MENKCCYCRQEVKDSKEGFIGIICFHNSCLEHKFVKSDGKNVAEHIIFHEG